MAVVAEIRGGLREWDAMNLSQGPQWVAALVSCSYYNRKIHQPSEQMLASDCTGVASGGHLTFPINWKE